MNVQEVILREKLNDYFSTVFEEELIDEIVNVGYIDKLKTGELLIDIDENMTHIPLILNGVVKVIRKEKKGEELALYFLEQGDTCAISFVNCINRSKSMFKAVVEKDAEIVFIPVDKIEDWLIRFKSWRQYIIDSYHFRLIEMVESIDSLAFMKMHDRVFKYLTDKVKITKDINLEITHQEIADDLHTSRVVVTRLLKQLHNEGKIYSSRNKIKVIDF